MQSILVVSYRRRTNVGIIKSCHLAVRSYQYDNTIIRCYCLFAKYPGSN